MSGSCDLCFACHVHLIVNSSCAASVALIPDEGQGFLNVPNTDFPGRRVVTGDGSLHRPVLPVPGTDGSSGWRPPFRDGQHCPQSRASFAKQVSRNCCQIWFRQRPQAEKYSSFERIRLFDVIFLANIWQELVIRSSSDDVEVSRRQPIGANPCTHELL